MKHDGSSAMVCRACGGNTRVCDSRPADGGIAIRRRRVCQTCGDRVTTFERPDEPGNTTASMIELMAAQTAELTQALEQIAEFRRALIDRLDTEQRPPPRRPSIGPLNA